MATTLSERAYNLVKRKIALGEIKPGDRVSELALAKQLEISRAPVREAISRLVSDGLLEKYPGLGAFVKLPSRRELEELLALRELLEGYAVREAAQKIQTQQVQKLRELCAEVHQVAVASRNASPKDSPKLTRRLIAADMPLHELILQAADNQQLMRLVNNFHIHLDFFMHYATRPVELRHLAHIWREHHRIVGALEAHDPDAAERWMKKHMDRSHAMVIDCFEQRMQQRENASGNELSATLRDELLRR